MKPRKITFIIPGAGRSGTTSLFEYLGQHPNIYTPRIKEIRYFSDWQKKGIEWYHSHFSDWTVEKEAGEGSTKYMYSKNAAKRIYNYNEKIKLLFILRDPVERAISNYKWEVARVGENRRFGNIIPDRYIEPSMYGKHMCRFLKYFERNNIKVILFENFKENPQRELKKVFRFLGLDENVHIKTDYKKNKYYQPPISMWLQRKIRSKLDSSFGEEYLYRRSKNALKKIISYVNHAVKVREFPKIREKEKNKARKYVSEDIKNLEVMLGKNLDRWKT
ncbi:sulfotransferase family protein [Salinibacter ruber]|uniref:sulfotransferase family protein n=1 Tax=Salinibacter ruber TaxID=146919 RepID=UPI002074337E|nr:sulfotransferase [Salinibacter ruber]